MIAAIVLGCLTLVVAVGGSALWRRLPPRAVCPSCGQETQGVVLAPPLRVLRRLVRRRWCPSCRWAGFGRNGPVLWARNGRVAHDSGFHWSARDLPPDMGFRWGAEAEAPPEEGALRPPLGFRWGGDASGVAPEEAAPNPYGFRWGDEPGGGDPGAATRHPAGFRWARADVPAPDPRADDDPPSEAFVTEGPEGRARRLLRLDHAERTVGFRWGGS